MQTTNYVFTQIKTENPQVLPPPPPPSEITSSTIVFFTIAVAVFCSVGFTVVFFCRCFFGNLSSSNTLVRLSPHASPYRGLDPSLLSAFPTFLYATVKDLRKEKKYSLECAICLLEFDDDSVLRLLTGCCHVFHRDCIDLWLRSHKTCPVCRTDLETPASNVQKPHEQNEENMEQERIDHVSVEVKEGDEDERDNGGDEVGWMNVGMQRNMFASARSHSTGHSIIMVREGDNKGRDDDDNKYTLRLPQHVKIVRGHHYSKSCSTYKDMARPSAAPCSNCGYVRIGSSSNGLKNI